MRVLPVDRRRAEAALVAFQIPLWSVIGALAWETGGVLVDHGWLRLLGGGGPRMAADLGSYNGVGEHPLLGTSSGMYTVALDAVGGGFVINQGRLSGPTGRIWYLAPDTLEWTSLDTGYTGFLEWALTRPDGYGELYRPMRWRGWRARVETLPLDEGLDQARTIWSAATPGAARPAEVRRLPLVELWQRTLSHRERYFDDEGAAAAGMSGVQAARRRRRSRWTRWADILRRIK